MLFGTETSPVTSQYDAPASTRSAFDEPIPDFHKTYTTKEGSDLLKYGGIPLGVPPGLFGKDKKKANQPTMAQKIFRQGHGQLQAYNALLPDTLDLEGRAASGFGSIYRVEADKAAQHDLNMFQALGPQYVRAIQNADPNQARIIAKLNGTDPMGDRDLMQSIRASQAARGIGFGTGDVVSEQVKLDRDRQDRLLRVGNFNQQVVGDPFLAVTGRASQTRPQGSNPMSPGYGSINQDALSLYVNNQIQDQQKKAANDANRNALYGAGIQAIGSLGGAGMAAI